MPFKFRQGMSGQATIPRPNSFLSLGLASLIVVTAICVAYWNSFGGALVFDDATAITGNASIRTLWPPGAALSPPPGTTVAGRPVANLSFAVNRALTGQALWGYHAGNLLIHIVNALLILGIVRRTLLKADGTRIPARDSLPVALAAALLWGLHPVATEAVTYVAQRVESLMALFVLLSLYGFVRSTSSGRRGLWLCVSSLSCLLGAGSKEVAAVAPALILVYDALFVSGSVRGAFRSQKIYYLSLAAGWLLLLVLGASSGWSRAGSAGFGQGAPAAAYWLTQVQALCLYLRLALWPSPLVFDYGTYLTAPSVGLIPDFVILAVLVAATAIAILKRRPLGYAGAWFFVLLLPTTLVPVAAQTMAEHRTYLPLAAIVLCLVLGLHRLLGSGRRFWAPVGVLALMFAALTAKRNSVYGSDVSLWSATVRDWPNNPRAHCSLGEALSRQPGGLPQAIDEFREAIRLHENYADAHADLGLALRQTPGELAAAIGEFERAIEIRPSSPEAHNDLGLTLGQVGRAQDARRELERALALQPDYPNAECNLGIVLLGMGEGSLAEAHLENAAKLDSSNARARFFLAGAFAAEHRMDEAERMLREVIGLRPDFAEAHSTLGMVLFRSGNTSEGLAEIDRAIRLEPDLVQAHLLRAAAVMQMGRTADARREFQRVLQLQAGNPTAAHMLRALDASR
ncbi:MAG TPA: tetratricopeptide repeat protein [Opitutaceae bacterium]|nr:tetratricopeptide repeat protein [Opitutaceae bacterium]